MLTPAHQAQLQQVVVDVGAKDLDKEEVEVAALQRHPGEAAEQAVVGDPPQHLAGCWLGPTREPTVEQEGQVEEEKAAHKVHVQAQVDAESLLGSEPAPEHPQREQKRCGSQLSRVSCCITAGSCRDTTISPHLSQPDEYLGPSGTSYLKKMQKAMVKMEKAMATPQPVLATAIKACAVDLSRAGFYQTCTHWVRQALYEPRKPDCSYQSHGADNPSGLLQGARTSPLVCPPRRYLEGAGWWWLRGDAP